MEIRTVRKPGDKGTRALMKKYGERLVCIRYRYDPVRKKRYKTIELVIGEQDWQPGEPHPQEEKASGLAPRRYVTRRVGLRIEYRETELRKQIKAAGGMWDPSAQLWFLPEEEARRLGLVERISKR